MNPLVSTLEFSKVVLSIFIMIYVYYFLSQSKPDIERKPWEYLYIATMFLFLFKLIAALQLFKGKAYRTDFFYNL